MKKQQGFSLIELMVVVSIIAIIAAFAMPSYRDSVRKSNRRAAQSVMMDIANREHQYFVANRAFAHRAPTSATRCRAEVERELRFRHRRRCTAAPPGFTINLTPIVGCARTSDGDLSLDQLRASRRPPASGEPCASMAMHVRSRGMTLIEVLVTMIILAIGLLGLVGLQGASAGAADGVLPACAGADARSTTWRAGSRNNRYGAADLCHRRIRLDVVG